jgi:hypothetical protein
MESSGHGLIQYTVPGIFLEILRKTTTIFRIEAEV